MAPHPWRNRVTETEREEIPPTFRESRGVFFDFIPQQIVNFLFANYMLSEAFCSER
jgi:hypothetical protein